LFLLGLSCREAPVIVDNIPCPAAPGSESGNLTVGADDRLYLSWIDVPEHAFMFSYWTGNGWSDPRAIYRGPNLSSNWTDLPGLIALADGALFAVWQIRRELVGTDVDMTDAFVLEVARSQDGGRTWSPPMSPHALGRSSQHAFASWSMVSANEAALIWLDGDEAPVSDHRMTLRFARVGVDSLPQENLIDERVCDCCPTDLRRLDDGSLLALYRDRSETEVRDIALARYDGERWNEGRIVHTDGWKIAGCPVNGPALDAQGKRVAVAWFTTDGQDRGHVRLVFSEDGGNTFGSPIEIGAGHPMGRVDLAVMPDGAAWVSWMEGVDGGAELRARQVDLKGQLGDVVVVAPAGSKPNGLPRMARLGNTIFLVWAMGGSGNEPSHVLTARMR